VFGKIGLAGQLDAIDTRSEVDLIDIGFEDLFLGELLFDLKSDEHLLELAGPVAFKGEKEVFCQLLGDGAASALSPHVNEVFAQGPQQMELADA